MNAPSIAQQNLRRTALVLIGVALIAVGLTQLFGRADILISQLVATPGTPVGLEGGCFPALVLTLDRAAQAWAFDRPALLSEAREILLSCWPVVLVLIGAILLQDWRLVGWPSQPVASTALGGRRGESR